MFGAKKKFTATQLEDGDSVWNLSAQWTKFRLIVSLTAKRGATLEIIRKCNVRNAREVEGRQTDGRTDGRTDGGTDGRYRQRYRRMNRQTEIYANEQTDRQRSRRMNRQIKRLMDRQKYRQMNRQ